MVNIRTAVFLLLAAGLSAGQNEGKQEEREPMAKENRETMTLFGIKYSVNHVACVGGAAAVGAATAFGVPALLGAIGFGPIGVIGSSLAALTQSYMGNVVAGSMFATLQSVAMTGGVPSVATQALIASALACGCLVRVD